VDTVEEASLPLRAEVRLRAERVARVLGMDIEAGVIENTLARLGFAFERDPGAETAWQVQAPSHRFDINIEADLIEEISRIVGYNALPVTRPVAQLSMLEAAEGRWSVHELRDRMIARGYSEAINYSFVDAGQQALFARDAAPVALKNPLSSEMDVMRATLLPGLIRSVTFNQNRQRLDVRLFEIGRTFSQPANQTLSLETLEQTTRIAGVLSGDRWEESWANQKVPVDFYDLKGDLEAVFAGTALEFAAADVPGLEVGQAASVSLKGEMIGVMGRLSESVQAQFDLKAPCYGFELLVAPLLAHQVPRVGEISKFPEIRRDIAVLVDADVSASDLRSAVTAVAGSALSKLRIFDVYQGKGIDNQRKSVGLGLTFQDPSRTLKDDEVAEAMAIVIQHLEQTFQAQLR